MDKLTIVLIISVILLFAYYVISLNLVSEKNFVAIRKGMLDNITIYEIRYYDKHDIGYCFSIPEFREIYVSKNALKDTCIKTEFCNLKHYKKNRYLSDLYCSLIGFLFENVSYDKINWIINYE